MAHWTYSRCSACDSKHRQVFPSGPITAKIALIGEGPGRMEDVKGVPFVGQSGQEQDYTYFPLADIDRRDVFVTNCVQCRCERNGVDVKPGAEVFRACAANHIHEELAVVRPEVVILAGATACSLVPGIDLELEHGFPRRGSIGVWEGWIVPVYHPAAGMHETRYMTPLLEDWERLGRWFRGKWEPPKFVGETFYRQLFTTGEVSASLNDEAGLGWLIGLPIDTESDEGKPYSIQYSPGDGQSFMLLVERQDLIDEFALHFEWAWGSRAIMHNAAYDLDMLERLGIHVREWRDTMQELYHLGNLPQGLKAAVYRVFGHKMTSYDEVVTPYSKLKLEEWLAEVLAYASTSMRTEVREQLKTKVRVTPKAHECEAVLRRVMSKLADEGNDYDPWQAPKVEKGQVKPRLLGRSWMEYLEAACGRMPRKSIVHAPVEQQIQYACSDADWTGRLAAWLEAERRRIVEEEWKVA